MKLFAFEERWAATTLASFALPESTGLTPDLSEVDYLDALHRMQGAAGTMAALGLRVAVWIVALAPLWLLGRARTIAAMQARRRAELLSTLLTHRSYAVRELTLLLKMCACMALFRSDAMQQRASWQRTGDMDERDVEQSGERVRLQIHVDNAEIDDASEVA